MIVSSKQMPNIQAKVKVIVVRKIEEVEISFDDDLRIEGLEISKLDSIQNTVSNLKSKIRTNLEIEFLNNKDEVLEDANLLGTGSKIRVIENDKILREYQIILYGDINGDGKINGIDLLLLQRHILEIEKLNGVYLKSANIRKTASKASSIDLLLIQRHILEIQFIEQ